MEPRGVHPTNQNGLTRMRTIAEVEERIAQEQLFLAVARFASNPIAIALAQAHITALEHELFQLRLIDNGGWKP